MNLPTDVELSFGVITVGKSPFFVHGSVRMIRQASLCLLEDNVIL